MGAGSNGNVDIAVKLLKQAHDPIAPCCYQSHVLFAGVNLTKNGRRANKHGKAPDGSNSVLECHVAKASQPSTGVQALD